MEQPKRVLIIGFHGPFGSGKDALAKAILKAAFLPDECRVKFADPMYDIATAVDPEFHRDMTHAQKNDYLLNDPALGTRRNFLEKLGTEFGRECISDDIWLRLLAHKIRSLRRKWPIIVVSDVRFENEAALIRDLGGHIFHLCPTWPSEAEQSAHKSTKPLQFGETDYKLTLHYGQIAAALDEIFRITGLITDGHKTPMVEIRR